MRAPHLITVIVPSYNHARFVDASVQSVLAQTHPRVELIVIDDASTDDSPRVLDGLRQQHGFALLQNSVNLGLNATIERGLEQARGDFVALLASDDLILPTKLAEQVEYLTTTGADGVFSGGYLLHPDGRREPIPTRALAHMFADGSILRHMQTSDTYGPLLQSGLFRAHVFRSLSPVRRRFRSDDWAATLHMLENFRIGFLERDLFVYRQHPGNTYRNYWGTFPMRAEVISQLTPKPLRRVALANLFESHSAYLRADGEGWVSFHAAGLALDPSARRLLRFAKTLVRQLLTPATRRKSTG